MRRIALIGTLALVLPSVRLANGDDVPATPANPPATAEASKPDKAALAAKAFEQGELLREECKWSEASKAYGKVLDADESNYLAHLRYQEVVIAAGEGSTLAAEYDDVVRDRADDKAAKLHRLRLNALPARLEALAAMRKDAPTDPLLLLEQGRALLASGDAAGARKSLEPAYSAQPDFADVALISCEAMRRSGDAAAARARLEALLKRRPDLYEANLRLARLDLGEGKTKESLDRSSAVLTMRPSYVVALLLRSEASSRLGKVEDARTAVDVALRVNPNVPESMVAAADLTAKGAAKEGLEKAIAIYKKAIEVQKGADATHALYGLGWALERLGRFKEAEEAYREASQSRPTDAAVVNSVGYALLKQKAFAKALVQFKKAIDLDPKSPEGYLNVAAVNEEQGDWNEALKQYQKVLSMKGQENNVRALLSSAFDQEALSQYKRAEEFLVRVQKIRPEDSEVATFLGDNLTFQKKIKPAIKAYQEAVRLDDKNRFAWRGLGIALAQDDKPDEAIEALERAKKLKGDDPTTLLVLGDLYLNEKADLQKALDAYKAYVKAGGGDPDVPRLIEDIEKELAGK